MNRTRIYRTVIQERVSRARHLEGVIEPKKKNPKVKSSNARVAQSMIIPKAKAVYWARGSRQFVKLGCEIVYSKHITKGEIKRSNVNCQIIPKMMLSKPELL